MSATFCPKGIGRIDPRFRELELAERTKVSPNVPFAASAITPGPAVKPWRRSVDAGLARDGPGAAEQADGVRVRGGQVLRQRGQWPLRIAGSLFGLACCALGLFSIFGGSEQLPALNRERAVSFGTAAIVVGLVALIGSLTGDAHRLWYCMPRRWRAFRGDVLERPRRPQTTSVPPAHAGG
jgi:hypothetical protein